MIQMKHTIGGGDAFTREKHNSSSGIETMNLSPTHMGLFDEVFLRKP